MATTSSERRRVRFQSFAFDLDSRELSREGRPVKLHPQPARVLALLLEQAGEIVDREEIKQKVWADSHVDFDLGINSCIRQIRIALGDDAEKPQFVETVTREGYRFITPVETTPSRGRLLERTINYGVIASLFIMIGVLGWIVLSGDGPDDDSSLQSRTSPFTTLPGWEFDPAISPDGSFVVFAASNGSSTNDHLYVKQIGGDEILQLTDAEANDFNPAWSPDGRRIAFLLFERGTFEEIRHHARGELQVRAIKSAGVEPQVVSRIEPSHSNLPAFRYCRPGFERRRPAHPRGVRRARDARQ